MSAFGTNDGFYQSEYNDPNAVQHGYGNKQDSYGYYGEGQLPQSQYGGYGNYPPQQMMQPDHSQSYSGQIMQPSQGGSSQDTFTHSGYSGSFDDEPPLLEELGINFDHIYKKTLAVLNPFTQTDPKIINETDLAGPLCFCLALGATLLLGGKISFGYIYGIGGLGVIAIYALLNTMSMSGVTLGCVASIIGYCILPMVLLSSFSIVLSLKGLLGILLTIVTVSWCSLSASKLFVCGFSMDSQQLLIAYPCALLYGVFALLTIF